MLPDSASCTISLTICKHDTS
uniref:Uncharacterized protein n=1 Tax=Arundo donax TaxID=35708 RepID=A0A0A9AT40_ARUDO